MSDASPSRSSHRGPALLALVFLLVAAALALTVDVPRTAYGIKSDEAVYIAAALSAAYDRNLTFERRDLERFIATYHSGPEGIFLKRGKQIRIQVDGRFPLIHVIRRPDPNINRLHFGKALIYPLVAAPFVRVFGMNGFLLLHVLLLTAVGVCGYLFLAARSSAAGAAIFTTAFLGASSLPVFAVFLMPEVLNFALVFVAYFLWLYKEVAPSRLAGRGPEIVAALLLGLATYSKPVPNALLVGPLILFAWWRREWVRGLTLGIVFAAAAGAGFALTAAVSGEFNYQGGDRRTFYSRYPFDAPDATWENSGLSVGTGGAAQLDVLTSRELPIRFAHNIEYFLVGRHFGFVPYAFPGAAAIVAWLLSKARKDVWRILIFLAFAASGVGLVLLLPYTWSGGGGPPGNRYLISAYPALFFLIPPVEIAWVGVVAWVGGALFTAKMLVSPFIAAKSTYLMAERGPVRGLPVELTMVNDLPIMLDRTRAHIPYGHDPAVLLYFLDQNASPPEPPGMWVSAAGRADIIVRTVDPIDHLSVSAESPILTSLTMSIGGPAVMVALKPGTVATFAVPAFGIRYVQSYSYLMTVQASEGFVPHVSNRQSNDFRNLGALVRFQAVTAKAR
jgi:hypothetical protein